MWGREKEGLKAIERFVCWGEQAYNAVEENIQLLFLIFVSDLCLFLHYHLFPILLVITVQALGSWDELRTALHAPGLYAPPRKYRQ